MAKLTLVIGNKNYSSWSLRAGLVMAQTGAPYQEILVPLGQPDTATNIKKHSPAGRVPVLVDGETVIWDSLAIAEYLAEKFPEAQLWPTASAVRARARSVTAEMHSGFAELRKTMPMNMRRSSPHVVRTDATRADIARIQELWRDCRQMFGAGGDYLFGRFSIADAFYAPVVARFHTYGVDLDGPARAYAEAVKAWPAYRAWFEAAKAEPWVESQYDL
jgi:glutathione S-transferase